MKRIPLVISIPCLVAVATYFAGNYFRNQQHTDVATVDSHTTMYNCAGERCIGFIVESVKPKSLSQYQGQLLLPYMSGDSRDQLQSKLSELYAEDNTKACLEGIIHKHSVDTLRLAHPAAGGYKIQLNGFESGPCRPLDQH